MYRETIEFSIESQRIVKNVSVVDWGWAYWWSLGGGVIASEYASIYQASSVKVTMINRYPTPLGFLDNDMTETFIREFEVMGGTCLGN